MTRGAYAVALAALVCAAMVPAMIPSTAASGKVLKVPQDYPTLAAAVNAAQPYDFILVGPGTYHEAVRVTTPHLTIRGVDRDKVVFEGNVTDCKNKPAGAWSSAITVDGANGVDIGNMTAHNYGNNGFFWDKVTGFRGTFLTAYQNCEYGIYAFRSTVGEFSHSYASANGDSGFYIGACFDCKSLITDVHAQNNGLGYSGTNAGGVLIQDSEWDNNMIGMIPNTLPTEDNGPQGGKVGDVLTNNYVHDNNNAGAPSTFVLAGPVASPVGYGILIAGGWNNQMIRNKVVNHKHYGISLIYLETPTVGNQVEYNDITLSGDADISWDGVGASNCFQGNTDNGAPATADPTTLETTNSCGLTGAPVGGSPAVAIRAVLSSTGITDPKVEQAQPAPGPQSGMPDVCSGAPAGCSTAATEQSSQARVNVAPTTQAAPQPAGYSPVQTVGRLSELGKVPSAAEFRRLFAMELANIARAQDPIRIADNSPDTNAYLAMALGLGALFFLVGAVLGFWRGRARVAAA
jgi:hypothetical protein